jgi:hypothetical protein
LGERLSAAYDGFAGLFMFGRSHFRGEKGIYASWRSLVKHERA